MAEPQRPIDRAAESAIDHTTGGGNDPRDSCRAAGRTSKSTAFLWAVLWNPAHRHELLRQGWKDVGKVFATTLDVVYQLIVHRGVYSLELLITAMTLAIVPYVLLRGPISRIAKMVLAARSTMQQKPRIR